MDSNVQYRVKERERLAILEQLIKGKLTNLEAALQAHVSKRQLLRLKHQFLSEGPERLIHGLRGARSNRRYSLKLRKEVVRLFTQSYDDYGPTYLAETLQQHHAIQVSKEWVRRLLISEKLWDGTRRKRPHRKKRPRRSERGALVQFDGSDHRWFEERGPKCTLLLSIDDATSDPALARFAPVEDTHSVLRFWRDYVCHHGIPRAIYTDCGAVYHNSEHPERLTDFGRALATLRIEHIKAHSPQAKGRVERAFRTFQDRLVKELRRLHIDDITEANHFLEQSFLPARRRYNARRLASEGAKRPCNVHRRCVWTKEELDNIFSSQDERYVYNDYTITLNRVFYQLEGTEETPLPLPRSKVTLRTYLDGSLHIFSSSGGELAFHPVENTQQPKRLTLPRVFTVPSRSHPWRSKPLMGRLRSLRNRTRKKKGHEKKKRIA